MSEPNPLSDDQLHRLIGRMNIEALASPTERRRSPRFAVQFTLLCQGLNERWHAITKPIRGTALNVSQGGILFDASEEIDAPLVLVRIIDGGVLAERVVEVVRRVPAGGPAMIAGKFVKNESALQPAGGDVKSRHAD